MGGLITKKAEMGIGTLILFIAMILVAAIAASVVIQTAISLQSRTLETGSRTTRSISSGMEALVIQGEDGRDGYLSNFSLKVKLIAGSEPMRFNDTLLEISTTEDSSEYSYAGMGCEDLDSSGYYVDYLIATDSYTSGYIHPGDVVMICADAPHNITSDVDVDFRLTPSEGIPLSVDTTVPEIVSTRRVFLYP
ncbi:MAG: archaellin/type IV pilin N-terminal domain-containing protein [Candidatus Woesearchaeota archaeon]